MEAAGVLTDSAGIGLDLKESAFEAFSRSRQEPTRGGPKGLSETPRVRVVYASSLSLLTQPQRSAGARGGRP